MKPRILLAALTLVACLLPAATVLADNQETAGGWGQECWNNVTCSSGRKLWCDFNASDNSTRSECTSHTGSVGWIRCALYDSYGNQTNFYSDQCP
jgi:Tfp pilus assembly protein PilV